jgi:hypothetical protein
MSGRGKGGRGLSVREIEEPASDSTSEVDSTSDDSRPPTPATPHGVSTSQVDSTSDDSTPGTSLTRLDRPPTPATPHGVSTSQVDSTSDDSTPGTSLTRQDIPPPVDAGRSDIKNSFDNLYSDFMNFISEHSKFINEFPLQNVLDNQQISTPPPGSD